MFLDWAQLERALSESTWMCNLQLHTVRSSDVLPELIVLTGCHRYICRVLFSNRGQHNFVALVKLLIWIQLHTLLLCSYFFFFLTVWQKSQTFSPWWWCRFAYSALLSVTVLGGAILPRAGGETQASSFHMMVSQETVCGIGVLQCSQNVRRRLKTMGQVLVSRTYVQFVHVYCRVPQSGAALMAYSVQLCSMHHWDLSKHTCTTRLSNHRWKREKKKVILCLISTCLFGTTIPNNLNSILIDCHCKEFCTCMCIHTYVYDFGFAYVRVRGPQGPGRYRGRAGRCVLPPRLPSAVTVWCDVRSRAVLTPRIILKTHTLLLQQTTSTVTHGAEPAQNRASAQTTSSLMQSL